MCIFRNTSYHLLVQEHFLAGDKKVRALKSYNNMMIFGKTYRKPTTRFKMLRGLNEQNDQKHARSILVPPATIVRELATLDEKSSSAIDKEKESGVLFLLLHTRK